MKTTSELHDEAMRLADEAFDASRQGRSDRAHRLFLKALDSERRAAEAFEHRLGMEPTRSVLYRSAATLAFHAGLPNESARLIAAGLAGNPPREIRQELDDLRKQAGIQRVSTETPKQFERDAAKQEAIADASGQGSQGLSDRILLKLQSPIADHYPLNFSSARSSDSPSYGFTR